MTLRRIVTVFYACGRCGVLALHAIEDDASEFICQRCRMVTTLPKDTPRKPFPPGRCDRHAGQSLDDCGCA